MGSERLVVGMENRNGGCHTRGTTTTESEKSEVGRAGMLVEGGAGMELGWIPIEEIAEGEGRG